MDREFIQRLRSKLGISQADLGRRLGISQSQVSRALSERGQLKSEASAAAFKLADDHAPDIADEARLLDRTMEALRESEAFRDLVRAALRIIHKDA